MDSFLFQYLFFGYFCINQGILSELSLAFIGQGFFATGQLMRKYGKVDESATGKIAIVGIITGEYLYWAQKFFDATVDYPSRKFGNIALNYFSGVCGSVLLIIISCIIVRFVNKKVKNIITDIGKNTFGILVFHFLAFKIIFFVLAQIGILTSQEVQLTIQAERIKNLWLFISIVSIILSILIWKELNKIAVFSFFLGRKNI